MKSEKKKQKLGLQILADKQVVGLGMSNERIIEISVTAPKKVSSKERPPLNLSLVIDRSGSMHGEKLEYARRAATQVVELLSEKDSLAVVTYDDTIQTLVPSQFMTAENKKHTIDNILSIRSGGSTNLGGGWLRGCEEVAKNSRENSFNRTLLLTDGLANVGMTSIEELSMHARQLFRRGVSTSCFGVGMGYDEHLLEAMANNGGGNFHFLETINAIPLVFEREFLELIDITVKDIEIKIKLPTSIKADVYGGWQSEITTEGRLKIYLGSLIAEHQQSLYVKLRFRKSKKEDEINLPVLVSGKGEGDTQLKAEQSITFKKVSSDEEVALEPDKELMARFAVVDLADKAKQALIRERKGDRAGAASLIQDSMNMNQLYMSPNTTSKYANMSVNLSMGLDEKSRKRFHQNEYESKRGRSSIRDYYVRLVKDYMIAEINGLSVLIDTGSKTSFGDQPEWFFLNRVHNLKQNSSGVSLEQLSQFLGSTLNIVLGMDILRHFFVTIDLEKERITFSQMPVHRKGSAIPMAQIKRVPVCQGLINGKNLDLFISTSTRLTYVNHNLVEGLTSMGIEKGFYPTIGSFETEVYDLPALINGVDIKLRCGVLPIKVDEKLFASGYQVIIGNQLFKNARVCLAFPDNQMVILP